MDEHEDDPAGETQIDRDLTPLDMIAPASFGAAPHARTPPPPPTKPGPPSPGGGKFAAPPPTEVGKFAQPIHQSRPVDVRPVQYFDQPVTEPPRSMVIALGVSLALSLLQAVTGAPSMLLLPGCGYAQIVFATLVAVTCWRGRTYGRPLAVLGFLLWVFAGALAFRGHGNMVSLLSYESDQRGQMSNAIRIVIVVRAALEAFLVWTLFRPDANKYFSHRAATDKLGGRKWE